VLRTFPSRATDPFSDANHNRAEKTYFLKIAPCLCQFKLFDVGTPADYESHRRRRDSTPQTSCVIVGSAGDQNVCYHSHYRRARPKPDPRFNKDFLKAVKTKNVNPDCFGIGQIE